MRVGTARAAAVQWVTEHARPDPGFRGAFFSGSTVGLPDDAELSPYSDVDIVVVTADPAPPAKPGKLRFRDALLEVSLLPWGELASADEVLSSYHLAGSFRRDTVVDDPTSRSCASCGRTCRAGSPSGPGCAADAWTPNAGSRPGWLPSTPRRPSTNR